MDTKLKTLYDFEFIEGLGTTSISYDALRQEAINWIKGIRYEDNPSVLLDKPEQTVGWIKHFFNLKDSDLE